MFRGAAWQSARAAFERVREVFKTLNFPPPQSIHNFNHNLYHPKPHRLAAAPQLIHSNALLQSKRTNFTQCKVYTL